MYKRQIKYKSGWGDLEIVEFIIENCLLVFRSEILKIVEESQQICSVLFLFEKRIDLFFSGTYIAFNLFHICAAAPYVCALLLINHAYISTIWT